VCGGRGVPRRGGIAEAQARAGDFARDYYEVEVDRGGVAHVVAMRPLTDDVVRALNPDANLTNVDDAITGIGYPISRHI
jgi:hypothetical protein